MSANPSDKKIPITQAYAGGTLTPTILGAMAITIPIMNSIIPGGNVVLPIGLNLPFLDEDYIIKEYMNQPQPRRTLSIEQMTGSYKFGEQLQIVVLGKPVRVEKRNTSDYQRIEIAIPLSWGRRLIESFLTQR